MQPQLFNFYGKRFRTVIIENEPYFVGKDVAMNLKYRQPADAIRNHVQPEDKGVYKLSTPGGEQRMTVVNESGLYDLIFDASRQSKNPEVRENARKFRHWVTSEVLPAIRKHGAYMTDEKAYDITHDRSGAVLADLLQQAADQLKAKDVQIAEMKPKALFADAVATSDSSILVGQLAKILKQNGIEIGQNRLFKWLRGHGYLGKRGESYNRPTQKGMSLGLFEVKERTVNNPDGSVRVTLSTKVTGKGQQYFINKFLKNEKKPLNAIGSSKEQSKAVVPADKIKDFKPSPYKFHHQNRHDED